MELSGMALILCGVENDLIPSIDFQKLNFKWGKGRHRGLSLLCAIIYLKIYSIIARYVYSGLQLFMLRIEQAQKAHTRCPLSVKDLTVNGQRITVFAPLCLPDICSSSK